MFFIPLVFYYESYASNISINNYRSNNRFHIANETNSLCAKLENLLKFSFPDLGPDDFIRKCYVIFSEDVEAGEIKSRTFNLLDYFGSEFDSNLFAVFHVFKDGRSICHCSCHIFYEDKKNNYRISEFIKYIR